MGFGASKFEKTLELLPESERFFGFENYGNTCYCNSILQALFFCVPFRERVLQDFRARGAEPDDDTLLYSLGELFTAICTQKKRHGVLGPRRFMIRLRRKNELFRGMMQQDAHEFLNYLLNEIAEQAAPRRAAKPDLEHANSKGGSTFVHRLFEGILTNETRCLNCDTVTSKDECFLDLSLDIEQNSSITSCLRNFSSVELMDGRDKFHCDRCVGKQDAQRCIKIKKLPQILVLHLKRFKYIEQLQRYKKLSHRVLFPMELRLQNTTDEARDPERLYSLFAIVIHIGSGPNQGHYVSMVKSHGTWLLFDDETIEAITERDIRLCFGSSNDMMNQVHRTECGYILFYESPAPGNGEGELDPELPGPASSVDARAVPSFNGGGHEPKDAAPEAPPDASMTAASSSPAPVALPLPAAAAASLPDASLGLSSRRGSSSQPRSPRSPVGAASAAVPLSRAPDDAVPHGSLLEAVASGAGPAFPARFSPDSTELADLSPLRSRAAKPSADDDVRGAHGENTRTLHRRPSFGTSAIRRTPSSEHGYPPPPGSSFRDGAEPAENGVSDPQHAGAGGSRTKPVLASALVGRNGYVSAHAHGPRQDDENDPAPLADPVSAAALNGYAPRRTSVSNAL